jgi:hypothetical protein
MTAPRRISTKARSHGHRERAFVRRKERRSEGSERGRYSGASSTSLMSTVATLP